MSEGLDSVRRDIEGPSEDARFAAWMQLYNSQGDEARQEIARILKDPDPVLKVQLLRILGTIPEERAVLYIRNCLGGMNPIVVEAAERAFDRNRYQKKLDTLIPVLYVKDVFAQSFAIDRLTLAAHPKAFEPLMALLSRSEEAVLIRILKGLRHFQDRRILGPVLGHLGDGREEVRYWALMAIGALLEAGVSEAGPVLVKALNDAVPRIRRAALWGLRRMPSERNLKAFRKISQGDADPNVRQEAILALGSFPRPLVILHLLKILITEKERMVGLRGEAVLIGMPKERLIKGLRKAFRHVDLKLRSKALALAAEYLRGSNPFFKYLRRRLVKVSSDKERLPYLEALGVLEDVRARPVLEVHLASSPILAYAAMSALLKIGSRAPGEIPVLKYLKDPELAVILKQMVLKYMIRKGNAAPLTDESLGVLVEMLSSDNVNIRYLASGILARSDKESILPHLLATVLKESDPTALKLLRASIVRLLSVHPMTGIEMLEKNRDRPDAVRFLLSMIGAAGVPGPVVLTLLPSLLGAPLHFQEGAFQSDVVDLIFGAVVQNKVSLEEVLGVIRPLASRDEIVESLVTRYRECERQALRPFDPSAPLRAGSAQGRLSSGQAPLIDLSLKTFREWLQEPSVRLRQAMIDLMGLARRHDVIPLLVQLICDEGVSVCHRQAAAALGTLVEARP